MRRLGIRSFIGVATLAATATCWTACTESKRDDGPLSPDELVTRMTLDEELSLVAGTGFPWSSTGYAGHVAGIPRLAIPDLYFADGASGVGNGATGVTAFACGISNAASFDPALARELGAAQGREHAEKGHHVALAPTINVARTPLNGRTFEGYGEDPYLVGATAAAYVQGVQSAHVVATPKHYAANNQETNRHFIDVIASERTLREIYYPGFEAAVTNGAAGSVMCSYNRLNGLYACENPTLLTNVLGEWGFQGFVVSDWWGTPSTAAAANAGLDLEMPGDTIAPGFAEAHFSGGQLKGAIDRGEVSRARLDDMVRRILGSVARVGGFDNEQGSASAVVSTAEHRALARKAAAAGTVLLKNDAGVLPLSAVSKVAVIGDDAGEHMQYTGFGSALVLPSGIPTTPFDAISSRGAQQGIESTYASGTLGINALPPLPADAFDGALELALYTSPDFSGTPDRVDIANVDFDALPSHDPPYVAATVRGAFVAPRSGRYRFSLSGRATAHLRLLDETVASLDANAEPVANAFIALERDQAVPVEIDLVDNRAALFAPAGLHLGWQIDQEAFVAEAAAAAADADIAIVFASTWSSENMDHGTLALPADQDELIAAVANANPKTIVVLHSGEPVLMPWLDRVAAVLEAWYPGEMGGEAIADILFGDENPSGKLPITFPATDEQTPLVSPEQYPGVLVESGLEQQYGEGLFVGYRWYDEQSESPLFAFGHGLSYTTFAYGDLRVENQSDDGGELSATVNVTNTGERDGAEVVQLYVGFPAAAEEPPQQLKDFRKVYLRAGESADVTFGLGTRAFAHWDEASHDWVVEPGRYRLLVGSSSRDIRAEASRTLE